MSRRPFIAGNWKMNLDRAAAAALASEVAAGLKELGGAVDGAVCPAFTLLDSVRTAIAGSDLGLGAQDVYHEASGAFTGEVSTDMLLDAGVQYVLTGHSERRHVIGETDELVGQKTLAALGAGLHVILCVGETIEERRAGTTAAVNDRQIRTGLAGVTAAQMQQITIAYEPVWAIGTGVTATPEDAQNAHAAIRALLGDLYDDGVAQATRIQYGGSMKPENAADLLSQPDIDGGLIGGASLKAGSFLEIMRAGCK